MIVKIKEKNTKLNKAKKSSQNKNSAYQVQSAYQGLQSAYQKFAVSIPMFCTNYYDPWHIGEPAVIISPSQSMTKQKQTQLCNRD